MGYTDPISQSAGTPILSADWNTYIRDNLRFLASPPACRMYQAGSAQSIPHNTNTAATFDSEVYDPTGMHSTSSNTSRITIGTAGIYVVGGGGRLQAATDYTRIQYSLFLNGTTVIAQSDDPDPGTANVTRGYQVSTQWKFSAADYVELLIYHTNGATAARNLEVAASFTPIFFATWVGLGT